MHKTLAALTLALMCTTPAAATPVVVRAAHLLDVERGHLASPGVVVVEGARITSVNPTAAPILCKTSRFSRTCV